MSCIHFKFKNRQEYEKVPINGLEISGRELKEAIMKKKKIGHSNLEITDAQSKRGEVGKEVYVCVCVGGG